MKERISKLLTIKSIVTIVLTLIFSYLGIKGEISGDQFLTVYTTVIGFYFGTQHDKNKTTE